MADAKHIEGELDCFFGNANGRGLTRIEVMGTGQHVASMPRGVVSEATALEICRRWNAHSDLLVFAKEAEEYLSCIALESDVPEPDACMEPCDDMCGNKLCDVNGCIKYRIRMARVAIAKAGGQ